MLNFQFNLIVYRRFPYMAPLQPVEPEEQKLQLLRKYQRKLLLAEEKFTLPIQKRYKCLLQSVSRHIYI